MKNLFYVIILISPHSYSQQISGYVYDLDGRVPNFPILNTTQNIYSDSNSDGYFEIQADVGDSIVLKSIAYRTYIFEVKTSQIENDIVIELAPDNLDEVMVYGYKTNSETLSKNLNKSIKNDIIKNPTLYEPSKGNIGYLVDGLIGSFKKNEKPDKQPLEEKTLSIKDFISLFKTDKILNETFLVEELKLPEKYQNLFFDYLSSKSLSYKYLEKERKLELIDLIYKYNTEYKSKINFFENEGM
ncbi:hypothetical protein [Formosa sp. PL04]|uniref:hypothetical protein n=1 Tax=Formosa sp. PL04 TaxID=3081755 RepID=UPI002981A859|nr:hypothetical protein [Formosa sp. PL04]MDW5290219.1 hypothetical protein [Formosa sp. PL04]